MAPIKNDCKFNVIGDHKMIKYNLFAYLNGDDRVDPKELAYELRFVIADDQADVYENIGSDFMDTFEEVYDDHDPDDVEAIEAAFVTTLKVLRTNTTVKLKVKVDNNDDDDDDDNAGCSGCLAVIGLATIAYVTIKVVDWLATIFLGGV